MLIIVMNMCFKKTVTKAVILIEEGQNLEDGFQLLIGLAEIHVPRMWVERYLEKPYSQVSSTKSK